MAERHHGHEASTVAAEQFNSSRKNKLNLRALTTWGLKSVAVGALILAAGVGLAHFVPWIPLGLAIVGGTGIDLGVSAITISGVIGTGRGVRNLFKDVK